MVSYNGSTVNYLDTANNPVTEILGLKLGGTIYDVAFVSGTDYTYNQLLSSYPGMLTFTTGDPTSDATAAVNAINGVLNNARTGGFDWVYDNDERDYENEFFVGLVDEGIFNVVYSYSDVNGTNPNVANGEWGVDSVQSNRGTDIIYGLSWAVITPVPVPAAVWLLGSGLVGLAGLRKRMKN